MRGEFEEQFSIARGNLGLSLEQVAEAIKVRVEYLAAIENGDYDQQLPDVYMRGFIHNYAKFLHLDVDEIMKNCPIKEAGMLDAKSNKKGTFVTIVTNENEQEEGVSINHSAPLSKKTKVLIERLKHLIQQKNFVKISGIILGILLILIFLFRILPGNRGAVKTLSKQAEKVLNSAQQSMVSLVSTGEVKVIVREKKSGDKIFAGHLAAGEVKKIAYFSPVQIFYDKGEFLMLKQDNGESIYPQPGRGGIEIK